MTDAKNKWANHAKRYLKDELKRADVGYMELARRLTEMGLPETEGSLIAKINRGGFPAWFLFAVIRAIDTLDENRTDVVRADTSARCKT